MTTEIEQLIGLIDEINVRAKDPATQFISYEQDHRFVTKVLLALKKAGPEIKKLSYQKEVLECFTIQTPPSVAISLVPSSAAQTGPGTAHNTHTPTATPSAADTAATSDRKSGNVGRPASVSAKSVEKRREASKRQPLVSASSLPTPRATTHAPQAAQPQSTPENDTV